MALFVAEGIPVVGQIASYVHGSFTDHDRWPASGRPRLAQGVRLFDRDSGRNVSVVHLHGIRTADGKADSAERLAQAHRVVETLDALRARNDVAVVCGDLNVLPDSATFDVLADAGLSELVGAADTRTSRYPKPVRHANYLAVNAHVARFEIVAAPEVSDHRALLLEL